MRFSEVVEQDSTLLQRVERITYRALKREFALDEEMLDDLKRVAARSLDRWRTPGMVSASS